MSNEYNNVDYWFEIAAYDLETAKVMLSGKRYLYVGFMCHQAIEKSLKGCFVACKKQVPPYAHNLKHLLDNSGFGDRITAEQRHLIAKLLPLHIEARYPEYRDALYRSLTEETCRQIIAEAEGFIQWIKNNLSK